MDKLQQLNLELGDLLFQKYRDSKIRIKDYFQLIRGKTPPTKNPEYYENGTLSWLNGGKLTNLYFLTDETKPSKLITEKAKRECKLLKAQFQSIIFSNVNTDKERLVWVNACSTFYLGEHIWQINSPIELNTATLYFALRQVNFSICSSGSVFSEVQSPILMNMKINWVSDSEKQKIFYSLLEQEYKLKNLTNYDKNE